MFLEQITPFFSSFVNLAPIKLHILGLNQHLKTLMTAFSESVSREVQKFLRNGSLLSKTGILPVIANTEKRHLEYRKEKIYDICL